MADSKIAGKVRAMAENKIKGDAPNLFRKMIGYLVLDAVDKEGGGQAVLAAIGYRIGDKWAFTPVVFEDGNINGTELLWIRDWDKVVPARDNWVTIIEDGSMDEWALPTRPDAGVGNFFPDVKFTQLGAPKTYGMMKTAAESDSPLLEGPIDEFILKIAAWAGDAFENGIWDRSCGLFSNIEKEASQLADAIREKKNSRGGIRVVEDVADPVLQQLTSTANRSQDAGSNEAAAKVRAFFRQGYYIHDDRTLPNTQVITRVNHGIEGYVTPSVAGIYQVLDSRGTGTIPCMVFPGLSRRRRFAEFPNTDAILDDRANAFVVPMGGDTFGEWPIDRLLTMRLDAGGFTDIDMKFPGLPATAENMFKLAEDKREAGNSKCEPCCDSRDTRSLEEKRMSNARYETYMFMCGTMDNPLVVHVNDIVKDWDGYKFSGTEDVKAGSGDSEADCRCSSGQDRDSRDVTLVFSKDAKGVIRSGNTVLIPKTATVLIKDTRDFKPGSKETFYSLIFGKENLPHALDVTAGPGGHYRIEVKPAVDPAAVGDGRQPYTTLDKQASTRKEAHLILAVDCGIPAGDSAAILNEADQRRKVSGKAIYLCKSAQLSGMSTTVGYGPEAQITGGLPTERVGVNEGRPENNDKMKKLSEILDTSGLETIAKMDDLGEFNKSIYKNLLETTDDLGRKLAAIYWHRDQFTERFGDDDLDDLITRLRQAFQQIGDFLAYLSEKSPVTGSDSVRGMLSRDMATPGV